MSNNRNRPRLEGRCSPEVPPLVDKLTEVLGANKSDVLETAVRLLAEVMGLSVPMSRLVNAHPMTCGTIEAARDRAVEHFDRVRSEYERARHEASSAGGIAKRENLRNGVHNPWFGKTRHVHGCDHPREMCVCGADTKNK